ncbi:phosphoribosylpyrophosphate synthetase [Christiangramia fulva]|uniref:Phosphoribosylpyrophosphate synthetase n=1 Tax=Christiangramia fulva TaxID=2126553 RepID=A0A2R3Z9G2_9FLAO|nr:phosphoribosylpyrophosphate synthetase [Christiangramia fulva]AVR46923.1 phosphoribosylpyrophosphate synthetase [Christiangramia fulva]
MKRKGTLSQTINMLRLEEGYEEDFNLLDEKLKSKSEKEKFLSDDFVVDEVYRFEGASNPGDEAILYAISTSSGRKGILVDGYDYTSGQVSEEILKKLDLRKNRPIS